MLAYTCKTLIMDQALLLRCLICVNSLNSHENIIRYVLVLILILQIKKLKHGEAKKFVQYYTIT